MRTVTRISLILAVGLSVVVLAAGLLMPVYQGVTVTSSGVVAESTDTLVGANGLGGLLVVAAPLLAATLVAVALVRGTGRSVVVAWALAAALGLLCLLSIMTVGLFIAPVAGALVLACATAAPRVAAGLEDARST